MILKTYLNKAGKQKWLNAVDEGSAVDEGDIENSVSVYYGSSFSTSEGIYSVVTIKKYSHPKNALPGYKESIEGTIRIFQYTGGTCYYRVNVEDNMDGKTEANNLFYSVMRNRFYNVNISKLLQSVIPMMRMLPWTRQIPSTRKRTCRHISLWNHGRKLNKMQNWECNCY